MAKLQSILVASAFVVTSLCGSIADAQSTPKGRGGPVVSIDLCTFLTQSEAEEILGKKLQPPERRGRDCWYGSQPGAPDIIISFVAAYPRSRAEFDAFIADQVKTLNKKMKELGAKGFVSEPVKELSDPAYYVDPSLYVYRNNRVLGIFAERPQALKIAAKALPRWKA